jgi:hypothetical protein
MSYDIRNTDSATAVVTTTTLTTNEVNLTNNTPFGRLRRVVNLMVTLSANSSDLDANFEAAVYDGSTKVMDLFNVEVVKGSTLVLLDEKSDFILNYDYSIRGNVSGNGNTSTSDMMVYIAMEEFRDS